MILTRKCDSRQDGTRVSDISTSKSDPRMVPYSCSFAHVLSANMACTASTCQLPEVVQEWCAMCLVFFLLGDVLRAKFACPLLTCQLPDVLREWRALQNFHLDYASHHTSLHFFDMLTSKSGPNMRCLELFHLLRCFRDRMCCELFIFAPLSRIRW